MTPFGLRRKIAMSGAFDEYPLMPPRIGGEFSQDETVEDDNKRDQEPGFLRDRRSWKSLGEESLRSECHRLQARLDEAIRNYH
jgi:hypothetical protein